MSVICPELIERAARYGAARIEVVEGRPIAVRRRLSWTPSLAAVWWHTTWGRKTDSRCVLDYHIPRGLTDFVTLDFIHSVRAAGYATFRTAVRTLEAIAHQRNSHAIVAHVANAKISDRLLERLGWQRHCLDWKGRHWIRRFA